MTEAQPGGGSVGVFTFINVFEIDKSYMDAFIEQWRTRSRHMQSAAGFLDATLYRATQSDTEFQLINVTHWQSQQDFETATEHEGYQSELQSLLSQLSDKLTPHRGFYEPLIRIEP